VIETHAVGIACRFVALGLGLTIANALLARAEAGDALVTRPFESEIHHGFAIVVAKSTRRRRLFEAVRGHVKDAIETLLCEGEVEPNPCNLTPRTTPSI
jgi:DNA-binding transcriptional LysR family regulator